MINFTFIGRNLPTTARARRAPYSATIHFRPRGAAATAALGLCVVIYAEIAIPTVLLTTVPVVDLATVH